MNRILKWGIIGSGSIARAFARGLGQTETNRLVAVGSRSKASAQRFVQEHTDGTPTAHGSYEQLLGDDRVEAVYIATPHPMHAPWAIRAAESGKHILCEKPCGINHAQAKAMIDAADRHGTLFMEAFMYRCHPQTIRLVELIGSGVIGEVRLIQGSFGYFAAFDPESRVYSNDLAGGGILDVGCYPVSMARLLAGAAMGQPFADPESLCGEGYVGETGVDEWAAATLKFPNNVVAQVSTSVACGQENTVRVFGSEGWIHVPEPWTHDRMTGGMYQLVIHRSETQTPQTVTLTTDRTAYAYEAEVFAKAVAAGRKQPEPPAMTWADTLGNIHALDRWRAALGVVYEQEKSGEQVAPGTTSRPYI